MFLMQKISIYYTENGTHNTQSTSKIATTTKQCERKEEKLRSDGQMLDFCCVILTISLLHLFILLINFSRSISIHNLLANEASERKKNHTGTRLPFIETKKENKTFHIELLYFAKCCNISHTIIIFIWRVLYVAVAAFNELTDEKFGPSRK